MSNAIALGEIPINVVVMSASHKTACGVAFASSPLPSHSFPSASSHSHTPRMGVVVCGRQQKKKKEKWVLSNLTRRLNKKCSAVHESVGLGVG